MRLCRVVGEMSLAAMLCGCIPSLRPLYTEKDIMFDPSLVGEWGARRSNEILKFEAFGDNEYKLTYIDRKGKRAEFKVHLLKIKGHMFLDLLPINFGLKSDVYLTSIIPAHTFFHVEQIEPTLRIRALDYDWLEPFLAENPKAIAHEKLEESGMIVLTAKPKELQQFVIDHLDTEGAFHDFGEMTRTQPGDG